LSIISLVTFELAPAAPARDRRVRRSRQALIQAAIALVTERDTAAVPLSDIAQAADVSRQVVYQQFGDRDTLLLEAALDLARRELLPQIDEASQVPSGRDRALATARHFADYRVFYRAVLTGASGFALNRSLSGLIIPLNRQVVEQMSDGWLGPKAVEDLAMFLTGGAAAVVNTWIVEGETPLDPEKFTDRLMFMMTVLTGALHAPEESSMQRSNVDEPDQPSPRTRT
jgi:AcrR family transcriptional regulator